MEQQPVPYDYKTAFTNLQRKIQQLDSIKEQHQGQSTPLGRGLYFIRQHRGSLLLLFAMYSMSTASVVSAVIAENRLQVSHQLLLLLLLHCWKAALTCRLQPSLFA